MSFKEHRTFNVHGQNERDICRTLGCVGILNEGQLVKNFGRDSLRNLIENNMIKSFNSYDDGKINKIYHLSETGKKYTRKHLVYGSLYRWNKLQVKHDTKLADIYLSLTRNEQKSWQNESQIRKYNGENVSGIDASYTSESGESIAVEVVTNSYSRETFRQKVNTMKENYQGVNVKFA